MWPKNRQFTPLEAWLDLLMSANHRDNEVMIGYEQFSCRRGECMISYREWARRWNWSESRVRRMFQSWKKNGQISTHTTTRKTTHVRICNYEIYHGERRTDDAASDAQVTHERRTSESQVTTTKECKNEKNDKNNTPLTPRWGDDSFDRFWAAYPRKVGKGAAVKSWARIKKPGEVLTTILAALKWQTRSEQWTRDGGQYIPHPATYLNQRRWEDEPPAPIETQSTNPIHQPWRPDSD